MNDKSKPDVRISYNEVSTPPGVARKRNWKPFAIRTPFLAFVIACMFTVLILMQILLMRAEPYTPSPQKRDLRRQIITTNLPDTTTSTSTSVSSQSRPNVSYQPNPDAFLDTDSTTKTTKSTTASTSDSITSEQFTMTVGHPAPESQLDPKATSVPVTSTKNPDSSTLSSSQVIRTTSVLVTVPLTSSRTSIIVSNGRSLTSVVVVTTAQVQTSASIQTQKAATTSSPNNVSSMFRPDLKIKEGYSHLSYFAAMFLPAIIAVMLREVWAISASGLKMMEPFYLLNHPDGANVEDSLMADYLASSTTSWYTYSSAWRGNPSMILLVLINLVVSLLAPVASESMTILVPEKNKAVWAVSMPLLRTLQGMLAFISFVIIYMIVMKGRRQSGLSTNPSKIAAMADLVNHPSIIQDLQSIHPSISNSEIVQALAHNRYTIADYRDQYGNARYGLIKVGESTPYGLHRIPMNDINAVPQIGLPPQNQDHTRPKGHSTSTRAFDVTFIVVVITLLGVLVAYKYDGSTSGFNNFMNSETLGPRFLLSLGALSATVTFQHLEREVRLATPYRELAGRGATPASSILRSVNGTAMSNLILSVRHGTWYHFFIGITAMLGDVLIIVIPGVPFKKNQTKSGYHICMGISLFITSFMLLASITVFRWRHHTKKLDLPHESHENLIRVMMLVSNPENQLRIMLEKLKDMSESEAEAHIKQQGSLYWAGWTTDRNGREMWCVDKEADSGYSVRR